MEANIREFGKSKIVSFGESFYIDVNSIEGVRAELVKLIDSGNPHVVVDFKDVVHIDSSGLGGLIEVMKYAKIKHGALYLVNLSDMIMEIFQITKLSGFFTIFKSEREMRIKLGRLK